MSGLYGSPLDRTAQAIRANLLAVAVTTTLRGALCSSPFSQPPKGARSRFMRTTAARAPWMRSLALTLIRARNLVVRLRTAAVNAVRGLAKPCGYRLPASSTLCFAKRCMAVLPPGLAQALGPVLEQIAEMTKKIKVYDRAIK